MKKILDDENRPTLKDWLGINHAPDYSKARWLGGMVSVIATILVFAVVLPSLFQFLAAVSGMAEFKNPVERYEAIRNSGLVIAALIGVPFIIWRSVVAQKQVNIAHQGLTTDRINQAVQGLGADKTNHEMIETPRYRKIEGKWKHDKDGNLVPALRPDGNQIIDREHLEYSVPNIEVRIGAIYALERLAQEEPTFHIQIMEILCAYIRHNAPVSIASDDPENLAGPRDDIQVAMTTLGRRTQNQIAIERNIVTPDGKGHRLDLRNTCLQKVDISHMNFSRAIFRGAKLQVATLEFASLFEVDFSDTNFQYAHVRDAELQGSIFKNSILIGANFGDANLQSANLLNANLQRAILKLAILKNANFHRTNWEGASLAYVDLNGANLKELNLKGVDLTKASLHNANLESVNLENARLVQTHLQNVNLKNAILCGAKFEANNMQNVDLENSNLKGATIGATDMSRAKLWGTKIASSTALDPDSLRGAGLRDVHFNTIKNPELLAEAFGDASVSLPDGYVAGQDTLAHWSPEKLDIRKFITQWRAHQKSIGYDPKAG